MAEGNMESWVGKDKVVVQTKGIAKRSDFHIVDLRNNKVIKLGGGFLWNHNMSYGLIAAGSVIYAIGNPDHYYNRGYSEKPDDVDEGDYHIHCGASFLDLEDPRGSWKDIGGMLNCYRSYPCCASLGDNIFVFGAHSGTSLWSFGEFYDKKNGRWQAIPMSGIDHQMHIACPVISDPKNNRLLVYFDLLTSLYAYYPHNNHQWLCLDDNMLSWRCEAASSPVDGVLYFIICNTDYSNCITAYDILTKECLKVSWSSCSPFGPDILDQLRVTQMLHLGGNILCFTHTDLGVPIPRGGGARNSFWEYYRFQVRRDSQQKVLLTPLSVHRLHVPVEGCKSQLNTIAL